MLELLKYLSVCVCVRERVCFVSVGPRLMNILHITASVNMSKTREDISQV